MGADPPSTPDVPAVGSLARSLQDLFAGRPARPLEIPELAEKTGSGHRLRPVLELYLATEPAGRASVARALRAEVDFARGRPGHDGILADAVERLSRDGERESVSAELARALATPGACRVLVDRLRATARDEARRDELVAVARVVGAAWAPHLAEALHATEDRRVRRTLLMAMAVAAPAAPDVLKDMLSDARWYVVRNGVAVMGAVGREDFVAPLQATLTHEHPRVRRESVLALARIGGDSAGRLVLARLRDPDADVRSAAVMALGVLGQERALRPLLAALDDEVDADVQVQITRALGQLGDPAAVPALQKKAAGSLFSRTPTPIRIAALRALAAIGTPRARELVRAAVEDKDSEVRAAARVAIRERHLG